MAVTKVNRLVLFFLHFIVGFGALAGGLGAILNPISPGGASTELLKKGPFETFLIPGLILFTLFGLGNLGALTWLLGHWRWSESGGLVQGYVTGTLGAGLILWIVVQCYMMQLVLPLHIIMFAVGAVQGLLALKLLWDREAFPVSLIRKRLAHPRS